MEFDICCLPLALLLLLLLAGLSFPVRGAVEVVAAVIVECWVCNWLILCRWPCIFISGPKMVSHYKMNSLDIHKLFWSFSPSSSSSTLRRFLVRLFPQHRLNQFLGLLNNCWLEIEWKRGNGGWTNEAERGGLIPPPLCCWSKRQSRWVSPPLPPPSSSFSHSLN